MKEFVLRGCFPIEYISYDFYLKKRAARRRYLVGRKRERIIDRLNPADKREDIDNKAVFNKKFSGSLVFRDWLYCENKEESDIVAFADKHKTFMVKAINLSGGHGISSYTVNGNLSDFVAEVLNKKLLLEEKVENCNALKKLHPESLNTLRTFCVIDKTGTPSICAQILRVGNNNNSVDNYHSQGLIAPVDIETGIITEPACDLNFNRYIFHPTTNEQLLGFVIPNYQEAKNFVLKHSKLFPEIRYQAWDIAITEHGIEVIEINSLGDPTLLQMFNNPARKLFKNL